MHWLSIQCRLDLVCVRCPAVMSAVRPMQVRSGVYLLSGYSLYQLSTGCIYIWLASAVQCAQVSSGVHQLSVVSKLGTACIGCPLDASCIWLASAVQRAQVRSSVHQCLGAASYIWGESAAWQAQVRFWHVSDVWLMKVRSGTYKLS